MFVIAMIQKIRQPLVPPWVVPGPQVTRLSVFGDMLTEEPTTGTARSRAVAFGISREHSTERDHDEQQCDE